MSIFEYMGKWFLIQHQSYLVTLYLCDCELSLLFVMYLLCVYVYEFVVFIEFIVNGVTHVLL